MKQKIILLPTRRSVLEASLVAGAAVTLVSCGSGGKAEDLPEATGAAKDAIDVSRLPVQGTASVTVDGRGYLLYRPDEATVLAYTSVCTHQGCKVGTGSGEIFECPCHGSRFSKTDGSVAQGPAKKSLTRFAAAIEGDKVKIYL
ncbi:ubiquinol-cytochrome c reductase iron-sulfur subunit [Paeniglutamicibacter sp. MACA_103]|uniref:ubiquinol-cytochrome c reductase iron-sulfur subunit n=1 Tax=Paeniglutamicibacter sp. MACA_103 TaxID=3377337 RepID=UPI003895D613